MWWHLDGIVYPVVLSRGNVKHWKSILLPGSVAERSKALVLGTSLLGGVGSNPTAAKFCSPCYTCRGRTVPIHTPENGVVLTRFSKNETWMISLGLITQNGTWVGIWGSKLRSMGTSCAMLSIPFKEGILYEIFHKSPTILCSIRNSENLQLIYVACQITFNLTFCTMCFTGIDCKSLVNGQTQCVSELFMQI